MKGEQPVAYFSGQLCEYDMLAAQYLYLPRLRSPALLIRAAEEGPQLLTWEQHIAGDPPTP